VIDGSTLTYRGALVESGTTYPLPIGGTVPAVVAGSFPTSISLGQPAQGSGVVIGGQALTPGGTLVYSGTTYLLPSGATMPLPIATASFGTTEEGSGATLGSSGSSTGVGYVQASTADGRRETLSPAALAVLIAMAQFVFVFYGPE